MHEQGQTDFLAFVFISVGRGFRATIWEMRFKSLLLAAAFIPLCPAQTVPTPESVLGHKPGDDFYLANYQESRDYVRRLAASSNRIKLISVGKTTRGLDWEIAIISSPANLAALDRNKLISQRLAHGRGLDDAAAHALAREGKAIVHIDGGLHSTEVAGAQQSILLAYKLVSTQGDPDIDAILDNVILMLWPTLNPDGQEEVVSWYRKNLGTPYEVSPLPDLYQEYVGHDNNRDGYMNNMLESRDVTRTELEWDPVIFYCHHQTAPFPTRIFIPPFTEPISSNIHPLMARWLNVLGIDMAAYLDEHGMPGAVHRVGFDNWYPGFLDFTHIFRNSISFFTETALYSYATPHFYTVNDFPRDRQGLRSEIFYSSPWKGGWWRLGDAVRYMLGASMSVLDTAAKHRETLLYNRYQAARDNMERFRQEPPYAYVIPQEQRDAPTAAILIDKLLTNGIEVHQAAQPFAANGREYANAWVVLMDQPFSPLVKELFEPQVWPDLRTSPNGAPTRPYDVAGWTLPMQMGVEVASVLKPVTAQQRAVLRPIDAATPPAGSVQGTGAIFTLSRNTNASFKALNEALAAGGQASFAKGDIVLSGLDATRAAALARKHAITMQAVAKAPADAIATKKPRLGLYRPWASSIDEGWTRWILEEFGFGPVTLRNGDVQAGHLRERFDTILLADASQRSIMEGYAPGTIPGEYAGGIGEPGAEALRNFVREGGTLIAFNSATLFAIEQFHLPVTNLLGTLTPEQFYCSGSLLRVELRDTAHAAVQGLPREPIVMFERGPAFETKSGFRGAVLAAYPRDRNPLESGYLLHPERIQGKAAALEVFYGEGRVYLFGFRPQWRGQSHGTYKFFFNAIYDSPASSKPTAAPRAGGAAANPQQDSWRAVVAKVHADLAAMLVQNRAFFGAKGQAAVEERAKLNAAVDQFERDRIQEVQDTASGLDEAGRRKASELVRAMRRAGTELRTKEIEAGVDADGLAERYGIE
jgi:Zinc carboxypeptidase